MPEKSTANIGFEKQIWDAVCVLWGHIPAAAHAPEIGTVIDNAIRAIEQEKSLKNVLPKNYASPDLEKRVLGDVVDLFTNMDVSDTEESKDILSRTYE